MITNIRLGLATNSSSSHSLVWVPLSVAKDLRDEDVDGEFGWNFFTCASARAKKMYMGVTIAAELQRGGGLDKETCIHVLTELLELSEDDAELAYAGYIDHDSFGTLVAPFSLKDMLLAYHEGESAFAAYLEQFKEGYEKWLSPNWAVLGGNDNDNRSHLVSALGIEASRVESLSQTLALKIRKDEAFGFITIFNPNTGAKLRVSLDIDTPMPGDWEALSNCAMVPAPVKSSVPELADIKITDYCPYGCSYCYQGSTTEGQHADVWELSKMAELLGKAGVFEVALGGGEPTLHPDFVRVLENFRDYNVVPNFTTRNLAWLKHMPKGGAILAACGSFAVSVETPDVVHQLAELLKEYPVDVRHKVAVQLVMGTLSRETVRSILAACADHGFRVTLLGYKRTGRGITVVPQEYTWWLDEVFAQQEKRPAISIDTALAGEFDAAMKSRGVSPTLYHTEEGKFSIYIDAVAKTLAPSSYCETSTHRPFTEETWLQEFAKM